MSLNEALVTILQDELPGDYALPEPTAYSGTTSTMMDTGTSVSGKMLGSVVRHDVAQISISWNYLTTEVWSEINQLFQQDYKKKVRFFDQTAGTWVEREMYISDRSAGMWRRDGEGNVLGWTGCSLQFTEV